MKADCSMLVSSHKSMLIMQNKDPFSAEWSAPLGPDLFFLWHPVLISWSRKGCGVVIGSAPTLKQSISRGILRAI